MKDAFLLYALPDIIDGHELEEIREALDSGWITTGPKTHQFEAEFADYVGARHVIADNSCTAAMHLSLGVIGLQPGDLLLITPYTVVATATAVCSPQRGTKTNA